MMVESDTRGRPGPAKASFESVARAEPGAPQGGAAPQAERAVAAWCQWLDALGNNAEAALSAALAYQQLDASGRDGWLHALREDRPRLRVPLVAVYAPLLAVEEDEERRSAILKELGPGEWDEGRGQAAHALWARAASGWMVGVVVSPLYLEFVQVLSCKWHAKHGFEWVRHEPLLDARAAPSAGSELEGCRLELVPLATLVDDLAYAVLAHQRGALPLPEDLKIHAALFQAILSAGLGEREVRNQRPVVGSLSCQP